MQDECKAWTNAHGFWKNIRRVLNNQPNSQGYCWPKQVSNKEHWHRRSSPRSRDQLEHAAPPSAPGTFDASSIVLGVFHVEQVNKASSSSARRSSRARSSSTWLANAQANAGYLGEQIERSTSSPKIDSADIEIKVPST